MGIFAPLGMHTEKTLSHTLRRRQAHGQIAATQGRFILSV